MLNLDKVNTAALKAQEDGFLFALLVVRCLKTGGQFVSVRSQSPTSFVTGLRANAKSRDFGAYHSSILASMRRWGSDGHEIKLISTHKTRRDANQAKKDLVEKLALRQSGVDLNWNRPIKNLKDNVVPTGFEWIPEDEAKVMKAKAKKSVKKPTTAQVSA